MFETGPFLICPRCALPTLGVLSVGDDAVVRRCKNCRYSNTALLPDVDKKVVYIDQFAASEIFKVARGLYPPTAPRYDFWLRVSELVDKAVLLQRAIFPTSNLHLDEAALFKHGDALTPAFEMLGGTASFKDSVSIQNDQVFEFARAFRSGREPPSYKFQVDDILRGNRNAWLGKFHVSVGNWRSAVADDLRKSRDDSAAELGSVFQTWIADGRSFDDVLEQELGCYGRVEAQAAQSALNRAMNATTIEDALAVNAPAYRRYRELFDFFGKGVSDEDGQARIIGFYNWLGLRELPFHKVQAHLFALLAAKGVAGQRKLPGRGMLKDIEAISIYGPYVDALVVDTECRLLLEDPRMRGRVAMSPNVFSPQNGGDLIKYLESLVAGTPPDVRARATELYGL